MEVVNALSSPNHSTYLAADEHYVILIQKRAGLFAFW